MNMAVLQILTQAYGDIPVSKVFDDVKLTQKHTTWLSYFVSGGILPDTVHFWRVKYGMLGQKVVQEEATF